jgi:hypothetical protein
MVILLFIKFNFYENVKETHEILKRRVNKLENKFVKTFRILKFQYNKIKVPNWSTSIEYKLEKGIVTTLLFLGVDGWHFTSHFAIKPPIKLTKEEVEIYEKEMFSSEVLKNHMIKIEQFENNKTTSNFELIDYTVTPGNITAKVKVIRKNHTDHVHVHLKPRKEIYKSLYSIKGNWDVYICNNCENRETYHPHNLSFYPELVEFLRKSQPLRLEFIF